MVCNHVTQGWCAHFLDVPEHDDTSCAVPEWGDGNGEMDGTMARNS